MKKKLFFKLLVFAVIAAFVTVTSCKDYDDDISRLDGELSTIKADYASKIDALKTELNSAIDAKVKTVSDEVTALKTKVTTLETNAATKADIDAAKAEILGKVVALEVFNTFKTTTEAELTQLKADLAKAATKEELDGVEAALTTQLGEIQGQLEDMGVRVGKLESDYAALLAQHEADVADLIDMIADAKAELGLEIAAVQAALDAAEGRLDAKIDALDADLREILAEQLAKIEANATAIAAVAENLQEKYDELVAVDEALQEQITQNANDIAALILRVEAIEEELPKIKQSVTDLETKLNTELGIVNGKILSAYRSLDRRVYGLTFIPDFTSSDGTPQFLVTLLGEWYKPNTNQQSWSPKNEGTAYKGITYAKYHVSPSNATLNDFEVVGLLQKTSEVLFRSTEAPLLKALVDEVTLVNGILTVPVLVHADLYDADDYYNNQLVGLAVGGVWGETNVSVALQVKNKNIEDADLTDDEERLVVSSQYVRTDLNLLYAEVDTEEGTVGDDIYRTYVASDIHLAAYPADIELWNGFNQVQGTFNGAPEINLNDYVQAVSRFNNNYRLLEEFGYEGIEEKFVFELVSGINEGVNQSNTYVVLDGATGVIKVSPNPDNGNLPHQAAVGRTPVVLAKVVDNGKVYAVGYIKIVITDNFNVDPITDIPTIALDPFTLNCDADYVFTDGNKLKADMDKIFNHERVKLGKDLFFNEYTGDITHTISNFVPAISGNTADASDFKFKYSTYPDTQSGQLENYIEGTVSNTAPAGTYTIKTTLKSQGYRPDIILTWTIEVKLPVINLVDDTSYLSGNKIVVNPTIYEQGARTSAAYQALLNNAFMHSGDDFTYNGPVGDCEEYLTPYFVFTNTTLPSGYTVASNGTELRTTSAHTLGAGLLAARIEHGTIAGTFYVRLNEEAGEPGFPGASWGNYPVLSEAAEGLVGKTVSVQPRGYINSATYNWIDLRGYFNVEFTYPLELVLPQDAAVYDQANQGLNVYSLNLYEPNALVDWNTKVLDVTTAEGRALIGHYEVDYGYTSGSIPGYWQRVPQGTPGAQWIPTGHHGGYWAIYHPEVITMTLTSPFVFDMENITSNKRPNGTIDPDNVTYPVPFGTSLKFDPVAGAGVTTYTSEGVTYNVPAQFVFTWDNDENAAVQNEFKIAVPVSVKHKWGTVTDKLVITIKPGSGN